FCKATGDDLHLGIAYSNRVMLWINKRFVPRAIEDLSLAIARARALGYAQIERFASYNLAEFLHWERRGNEALPYARRAYELGQRFFNAVPNALDALLLARIAAAIGDLHEMRNQLEWVGANCKDQELAPSTRVLKRLLERLRAEQEDSFANPDWDAWGELVSDARESCTENELKEVLANAVEVARRAGRLEAASTWIEDLHRLKAATA